MLYFVCLVILNGTRDSESFATPSSRLCVYVPTKLSLFYKEKAATDITLLREIEFENGYLPSHGLALTKAQTLIRNINVATAES